MASSLLDGAFFSVGSASESATRTPTSSFYSSSITLALTGTATGTRTRLLIDETVELLSRPGTDVPSRLFYHGTTSASTWGDSDDWDTLAEGLYSPAPRCPRIVVSHVLAACAGALPMGPARTLPTSTQANPAKF